MVENPLAFESSKTRKICDAFDDAWALPPQARSRVSVSQVRREFDLRHTLFLQLLYPVIVVIRHCRCERHRSGHSDLS
jgi:hypothetical protein